MRKCNRHGLLTGTNIAQHGTQYTKEEASGFNIPLRTFGAYIRRPHAPLLENRTAPAELQNENTSISNQITSYHQWEADVCLCNYLLYSRKTISFKHRTRHLPCEIVTSASEYIHIVACWSIYVANTFYYSHVLHVNLMLAASLCQWKTFDKKLRYRRETARQLRTYT